MQWQTEYLDLCEEIEALELRAKDIEYQLKLARRVCFSGQMPGDSYARMPLDKALEVHDDVKERLLLLVDVIEHKKATKTQMEAHMARFRGLEYQVAYRRDIMHQSLKQIADDIGYSYSWVMKISMNTPRLKGRNKEESA